MDTPQVQPQETLRLTPQQMKSIFEALDREEAGKTLGKEQRKNARRSFAGLASVPMEVHEPGAPVARFLVIPHNLSSGGISVLHGVFVRPGTRCAVTLAAAHCGAMRMEGVVVRCRLITGRVHELGIKFETQRPAGANVESGPVSAVKGDEEKKTREIVAILATMLAEQVRSSLPGVDLKSLLRELSKECSKLDPS